MYGSLMRLTLAPQTRRLEPIIGWGLAVSSLGLIGAALWFPFSALPKLCAFLLLTDLPCLTCGMTRSWVALTHGDLAQALAWNPAGALLCVLTLAGALYAGARQLGAPAVRVQSTPRERRFARVALVVFVVANWSYVALAGRV